MCLKAYFVLLTESCECDLEIDFVGVLMSTGYRRHHRQIVRHITILCYNEFYLQIRILDFGPVRHGLRPFLSNWVALLELLQRVGYLHNLSFRVSL